MRKRKLTIGWGPKEDAPGYVETAFRVYAKDGSPATLIITIHAAESVSNAGFRSAIYIKHDSNLSFPHQVGEMFGFLGSFLGMPEDLEEEFVGLIFVNHRARNPSGTPPARKLEGSKELGRGSKEVLPAYCKQSYD